jgi:hypothetical protein
VHYRRNVVIAKQMGSVIESMHQIHARADLLIADNYRQGAGQYRKIGRRVVRS